MALLSFNCSPETVDDGGLSSEDGVQKRLSFFYL